MQARRTSKPVIHARRIRADTGPTDRRRLAAAFLSALLPGLGQLANGRRPVARRLLAPVLAALGIVAIALLLSSPTRLVASMIAPTAMTTLLVLNALLLAWRLFATLHAFFDRRYPSTAGRASLIGLVILVFAVSLPHALAHIYGSAARDTFARIFETPAGEPDGSGGTAVDPRPGSGERINILVVAIDKTPDRTATLTDTMMVISVDPVGSTVSMLSLPRDLVNVPLGNGDDFGPKLNSLMSYANRNPKEFPEGGMRALQDAIGTLLDIRIDYYAQMDFIGFVEMIDAVGGVDIVVEHGFDDPTYDGYGLGQFGWAVEAGLQHFDGNNALAYARARKAGGESDFTRAARQQEILVALRTKLASAGSLVFGLPGILDALGEYVRTDVPTDRLPELAAVADEMGPNAITRVVVQPPLVKSGGRNHPLGSVQIPQISEIRAVAAGLFTNPGTPPIPWPTVEPTAPPPSGAP